MAFSLLSRAFLLHRLKAIYSCIEREATDGEFIERALAFLNIKYQVSERDLGRIPRSGPTVVVANHPFGAMEGMILASVLRSVRPDVKVMANYVLGSIAHLEDLLILVDPFNKPESAASNLRGLRESIQWVRRGGALVVFPAGEVAHLTVRDRTITEPPWSETIARIIHRTSAMTLPVFFRGNNSSLFHLIGLLNSRLRTAMLPRELLNKRGTKIEMRVGSPIAFEKLPQCIEDNGLSEHLRQRTLLLAYRNSGNPGVEANHVRHMPGRIKCPEPIVAAQPAEQLINEVYSLIPGHTLIENGEYFVLHARAEQIPHLLIEIGRLREITFRGCGEGTLKACDIDKFDSLYTHLFLWNRERNELVGAYRLAFTDEVLKRSGSRGLYTNTLFDYGAEFLNRLGPSIELGRSFVREKYQRAFQPLFLLWKGIGKLLAANCKYRVLFGPVSISNQYSPLSRRLMVECLSGNPYVSDLSGLVRPKTRVRIGALAGVGVKPAAALLGLEMEELSATISEIEGDNKGLPVLLKHYLKLGGQIAGFNLDAAFNNVVDGLIIVDLMKTNRRVLERIMGEQEAATFLGVGDANKRTVPNVILPPYALPDRRASNLPTL